MSNSLSRSIVVGASAAALLGPACAVHAQQGRDPAATPQSAAGLSAPAPADAPPALGVSASAGAPTPNATTPNVTTPNVTTLDPAAADPWERANRGLYRFNRKLDRVAIRPGVTFYHHATPTPVRRGVRNILSNMSHPVIFMNDVLQLRPADAARSLARLAINSTAGIGGVFDVAARAGIPYHAADFGQTLGRYGVPQGPYVFLPVLGPATVRDGLGRIVDLVADPLNVIRYDGRAVLAPVRTVANGVNARDQVDPLLKEIDRTATDPYATTRSLYLQNRRALVSGSATPTRNEVDALPEFGPTAPAPAPRARGSARSTSSATS